MPEPLVTIRRYSSVALAEDDCQVLIEAGISAYTGGGYKRGAAGYGLPGEVRVAESQVQKALALLPPPLPDLLAPPEPLKQCPWCGGDRSRYASPVARYLVLAGVALAAWLTTRRQLGVAALVASITLYILFAARVIEGELVCANCGMEWRARQGAPEPEPEPEHEPRTQHPEG